jgi:CRP/FNR family transcriptional regulator
MADTAVTKHLKAFLDRHPVKRFKKGEIIIFQGEAPRAAFAVKAGTVKAYNLSVNGDEKPVAFYGPYAAFPEAWIYGRMANAIYYYEAFTPEVSLYMIDRHEYVKFVKTHPELMYHELQRHMMSQLGTSMRLNALQHSRASDKLLYTLHYLALSHGTPSGPHEIEITLDLTHQDFANLTGLTRETAATELNKLKHKAVISYDKKQPYRLNLSRLMQLLNDQYIADIDVTLET